MILAVVFVWILSLWLSCTCRTDNWEYILSHIWIDIGCRIQTDLYLYWHWLQYLCEPRVSYWVDLDWYGYESSFSSRAFTTDTTYLLYILCFLKLAGSWKWEISTICIRCILELVGSWKWEISTICIQCILELVEW